MRKPLILLPAALLLALSVAATTLGLADIYRSEAATLVEAWDWPEEEGPPAWAWEQVQRYLWLASRLAPFDPQIKSDLGQLYESRVADEQVEGDPVQLYEQRSGEITAPAARLAETRLPEPTAPEPKMPIATALEAKTLKAKTTEATASKDTVPEATSHKAASPVATVPEATAPEIPAPEASTDLDTALGYYRQALTLRPAWPQAWADVASLKITQEHIDAEFAFALQRALTLGPREPSIQAGIAGGGLTVWDQLPAQLQTDIEHAVQRGLSNGSRLMPLVARRFDLFKTSETKPAQTTSSNPPPEG